MVYLYLFIFIFFSKEFFYFDEELLVVFSFFIVFSFLFKSLSLIISNELDLRSKNIFDQFSTFLKLKADILSLVYSYYKKRQEFLFFKLNKILKSLSYFILNFYSLKINSLKSWYQRLIISKLVFVFFLENTYFKKEILNLFFLNESFNISFFSEFLLLNKFEINSLISSFYKKNSFLEEKNNLYFNKRNGFDLDFILNK